MRHLIVCGLLLASLSIVENSTFAQEPITTSPPQQNPAPAAPSQAAPSPNNPQATPPAQDRQPYTAQATKDANGGYVIRRYSRLVILDVLVTDAKGNIVPGLKKEDFNVTEAKEPQSILHFEEEGSQAVSPEVTINSTADLDRLAPKAPVNIILLDEFNTRFEDMAFARYSLKKFLEKQPDKLSTPTMLIAVSLKNFTVLHDYTQDKKTIISALDHHFVEYPWQTHQYTWLAERYGTAFATLMRVAQATIGHQGHKNMIWIGRGFPAFNFANVPLDAATRVNSYVQQCVNMLRDARVTLYTIDPAGVQTNPEIYGTDGFGNAADPFGGNYQFSKLAKATGGRALYGRNDVDVEISTGMRDGASFYTLAYRPNNTSMDPQKFRRIQVTINRPDLRVITREGYYLELPPGLVNPEKPSRRLIFDLTAAENSTMVYDGVPLTLLPSSTDPYTFTLHIESRGLVWSYATETEPRHTDIIVMATTFDKKGRELKRIANSIRVKAPNTVQPTGRLDRNLDVVTKLDHDPKAVRARFVVRVTATGRIGTADAALKQ